MLVSLVLRRFFGPSSHFLPKDSIMICVMLSFQNDTTRSQRSWFQFDYCAIVKASLLLGTHQTESQTVANKQDIMPMCTRCV